MTDEKKPKVPTSPVAKDWKAMTVARVESAVSDLEKNCGSVQWVFSKLGHRDGEDEGYRLVKGLLSNMQSEIRSLRNILCRSLNAIPKEDFKDHLSN
jgi:hypothetical protein